MFTTPTEFYRLDPLTGSNNFLSFVETLNRLAAREQKPHLSILYSDLNYFYKLNETRGHSYGDSILRWLEIVLREECNAPPIALVGMILPPYSPMGCIPNMRNCLIKSMFD